MRRRSRLLLSTLLWTAGPAWAAPPPTPITRRNAEVERLHTEAVALYQARRFDEALARFEAAHALFPDPVLVYNVGRCRQALGDLPGARAAYREVVADPGTSAALRARASRRVGVVEARIAERQGAQSADEADGALLEWGLIGGGAAAVVVGSVITALGVADHAALVDAVDGRRGRITRAEAAALDDGGVAKKAGGGALIVLGLAAAGVGTFLLLDHGPDSPVRASIGPQLGRPGVHLALEF